MRAATGHGPRASGDEESGDLWHENANLWRSLARPHRPPLAKAPARRRFWPALIQTERQSGTMGRENLLLWLSIAWLVLLCGGVVWTLVGL